MNAKIPALQLEHPRPDPRLASLLPPDIARRCHAVPIAAEGKRITVAMEHPDDPASRQAVVDSLGPDTYVVQANPEEMEHMLNELWPTSTDSSLHFMSWSPNDLIAAEVEPYAQSFAKLMDARLTSIRSVETDQRPFEFLSSEVQHQQADLLIFHCPTTFIPNWLTPNRAENQLIKQIPISLLVARKPRWPLRKILLVLRDSKFDAAAITWVVRVASTSRAAVTVLPIIAPAPPVFAGINIQHRSLIHLLGSTCPLGELLRQVSQNLAEQNIPGTLCLREGTIVEQIRQEVEDCDYDFAVIAADAQRSIIRWMMGELVNPLLNLAQIPTLLARPY